MSWAWKEKYGGTIVGQLKRVGASCDWSRERFTMDPGLSRAVAECFVRLYEKGLIYRGEYMVNWDPGTLTAISDLEVEYEQQEGKLWYMRYPVNGAEGQYAVVATTRPETMLGDSAVAVHPDDERYRHLVGKTVTLPLVGRELPVIADSFVDPQFGTGMVKITPAHDPNDFAAGKRHGLATINVLDEEARINEKGGKYCGLDRYTARERVVADLEAQGLIEKIEEYANNIGRSQRSGLAVEPRVSTQWFVKTKLSPQRPSRRWKTAAPRSFPTGGSATTSNGCAISATGASRGSFGGGTASRRGISKTARSSWRATKKRRKRKTAAAGQKIERRETDVLDTWFSSGLWPFSTMGWPDAAADLKTYYPTSLLNTGFDILFFWVARMMMLASK